MGVVVVAREKVRVVGGDDWEIQVSGETEDFPVERSLSVGVMGLNFEEVAVLEHVCVPGRNGFRLVVLVALQMVRDFASHACRRDDDSFIVFGEQLAVDTWLGVEAFRVGEGGELY